MTTDQRVAQLEMQVELLKRQLAEMETRLQKHTHNTSHIADCDCCSFDESTSAAVFGD